jgi:ABC-type multidrug transport system fused ATPase/permease subunit
MIANTYKMIYHILSPSERKKALVISVMVLFMALFDMIGVAAILPFITIAGNPEVIHNNTYLSTVYYYLGFSNDYDFIFFTGIVVFILLMVSLIIKTITIYYQLRFTLTREFSIGLRLIQGYLKQPYEWFLNRNSADLGKNILGEVNYVINEALNPLVMLFSQGVVALTLLALLIAVNPFLAVSLFLVLGTSYGLIYVYLRKRIESIGKSRGVANRKRFTSVTEAFWAVKDIKIGGYEETYVRRFATPARQYAHYQSTARVVEQTPKFLLEGVIFGGLIAVLLYFLRSTGNLDQVLPTITVYAFATYKLMPALQQAYASFTKLRYSKNGLEMLYKEIMQLSKTQRVPEGGQVIAFNDRIQLNNLTYNYPKSDQYALNGLSLEIPARKTIGLVGASGSGKTTTVDVILGLLEPQLGDFSVDDVRIDATNRSSWQKMIGYVPQQIYLSDSSIMNNIAFGLEDNQIDMDAVERAARIAHLHEFIVNELPLGYKTEVGERGVRLSGGQRQRIGIARALYHSPQILIMDEATSALDNLTEQSVMEAVNELSNKITIVLIAHRLTTVKQCHCIYLLEKGKVIANGSYDELISKSDYFKKMALV